jgi:glycosyltransferase involved in cell wall biosynthesis
VKIAIAVQGRFHAFDFARSLVNRGHDVTILTNYPGWAVERFGFPRDRVRSFWPQGVLARAIDRVPGLASKSPADALLHVPFGRWARNQLKKGKWDIVHSWSGISEELLREDLPGRPVRHLMRGSSHIRTQARLLLEEERRAGVRQDQPTPWIIAREEREYALADRVVVLSSFARESFVSEGVAPSRLRLLLLGARLDWFRPSPAVLNARIQRILAGEPLRVLYVGSLSYRKGLLDLANIARELSPSGFQIQLVGPQPAETRRLRLELGKWATLIPKQPQSSLPSSYAWGDIFIFPTIEDGYAQVLAQAAASALPILTTTNGTGQDLIGEGENGWVLPIRCPSAFVERLRWCDAHRAELASMVGYVYSGIQARDWSDVAADYEAICLDDLGVRRP